MVGRLLLIRVLAAACVAALAGTQPLRAADLPPAPETASLFNPQADAYTSLCGGRCAITVFAGPRVETPLASAFGIKTYVPPWRWDLGNSGLIAGAISRTLYSLWGYFDFEGEFGLGQRVGSLTEQEAWIALYGRWKWFPWNDYVRTTIAMSTGLNYADGNPLYETIRSKTVHGSRLMHYVGPEITFGDPKHPELDFLVRFHHRSGGRDYWGCQPIFKCTTGGAQEIVAGIRYHF